jgi:hypothetical protein
VNVVERCHALPSSWAIKYKCSQRATDTIGGYPVCAKHFKQAYKDVERFKDYPARACVHFDDGVSLYFEDIGWGIATPAADFSEYPMWQDAVRSATFGGGYDQDTYTKSIHIKTHGRYSGDGTVTLQKMASRPWLMVIDIAYDEGEYSDYTRTPYELSQEKAELVSKVIAEGVELMKVWNGNV